MKKPMRARALAALAATFALLLQAQSAWAMAKKPAVPAQAALTGKRTVALTPVRNVRIEMPDEDLHDFGDDFEKVLERKLYESGRYILASSPVHVGSSTSALMDARLPPPAYGWPGSVAPSATVGIKVEAMSFQTGSRGERMFYGFNERFRTPFNDGYDARLNEFPLRMVSFEPNWFDRTFETRGGFPFDSHAGLDLGDGFNINALFAWLSVKYALYHAELRLRLDIDAPLAGIREFRTIQVTGEGFYFDIAGAYEGYSAGIRVARRDAMDQALKNSIAGSFDAIDRALAPLPLVAKVDNILPDGTILLGSGPNAAVVAGTRYELVGHPEVLIEAVLSNSSGTMAKIAQGDAKLVQPGVYVREAIAGLAPPVVPSGGDGGFNFFGARVSAASESLMGAGAVAPAASEAINLPWTNISQSDLTGLAPVVSAVTAFFKGLAEVIFLPYRIWRYYQYDQVYQKAGATYSEDGQYQTASEPSDQSAWSQAARAEAWAHQIGLDQAPAMPSSGAPVVAVIDSGVDYNHWTLHEHLWLNSTPSQSDGGGPADQKDYYGWDFISGDSHPYDDGYHGTEVASLVAAVAPTAKIMPLKIFNPWGITSSAAIYGAFQYAVDHGAKIIVCGWATRVASKAIEEGVAYARDRGVAVIAAAGDRGDDIGQVAAYPAAFSSKYDNVLAVAGVTAGDQLVQVSGAYSNFGAQLVGIAAPGDGLTAATPRGMQSQDTSTGLSAALVAGAMARLMAADPAVAGGAPSAWIQALRADADVVPGLAGSVAGGLRLRVRK
jgi:hypothetical protein